MENSAPRTIDRCATMRHRADAQTAPPLGLWDAVSLVIGIVVGTAIFRSSPQVFQNTAGPWPALGRGSSAACSRSSAPSATPSSPRPIPAPAATTNTSPAPSVRGPGFSSAGRNSRPSSPATSARWPTPSPTTACGCSDWRQRRPCGWPSAPIVGDVAAQRIGRQRRQVDAERTHRGQGRRPRGRGLGRRLARVSRQALPSEPCRPRSHETRRL